MSRRAGQSAARALPGRQDELDEVTAGDQAPGPIVRARALSVVAETPARRRARGEAVAAQVSTLWDAVENLRSTVRFLEELMASRQTEAERALVRAGADLEDLRRRIIWVHELERSRRS